jgi:hypothetical protein
VSHICGLIADASGFVPAAAFQHGRSLALVSTDANSGDDDSTEADVFLDTLKLFYEESKIAREKVEVLVEKYRSNTSTLLALATAAVAFFGFSEGPRQPVWYVVAMVGYGIAVAVAFWIYAPAPILANVAYDTQEALFADDAFTPSEIYYAYAMGHQEAIKFARDGVMKTFGVANRFRLLIFAIALLVIAASLSVALGSPQPTHPTHIVIDTPTMPHTR